MTTKKTEADDRKTESSPWAVLSRIDVSDRIEKKNGLSYISWAWAWATLKEHFPAAWFRKHTFANGAPYALDMLGFAYVTVTVGLDGTGDYEVTEVFPVLNHRNQPIREPNSFEVNNALQRCLTKAIAYHGLGHYIYAGEELPPDGPQTSPEGRQGGVQAGAATTPAGNADTPPAARSGAVRGSDVEAVIEFPDGSRSEPHPSVPTIEAVFTNFIPTCTTKEALVSFYSLNKEALQYVKDRDADAYVRIGNAFSEQRKKFTAEQANTGE